MVSPILDSSSNDKDLHRNCSRLAKDLIMKASSRAPPSRTNDLVESPQNVEHLILIIQALSLVRSDRMPPHQTPS